MSRFGQFTGPQTEFGVPLTVRQPADNVINPSKVTAPAEPFYTIDQQLEMSRAAATQAAKQPTMKIASG
jgi:hypothetical protein